MKSQVVRLGALCDVDDEGDDRLPDSAFRTGLGAVEASHGPVFGSDDAAFDPTEDLPEPAVDESPYRSAGPTFGVTEFVELGDGRRVTLRDDRGFGGSRRWRDLTMESLEHSVRMVVLPDDDDDPEDHPWDELAALAGERGIEVSPSLLRTLPYVIEFSGRVRERLPEQ